MGAEIKSSFLKMLHVTPEYNVVVSNPAEIMVDDDESEIILQLRGYITANRTSRESWQRFRQRKEFEWTKITGWIQFWPQLMDDQECVLDVHDHFTMLTEWGSRKFFFEQGRAWASRIEHNTKFRLQVRARSNAKHSLDRPAKEQSSNNRSEAIA